MQLTSTVGCIKSSTHFYTVFYAQSVVHRLQSVFYTDHVNKSTQSMPVPWVCETTCFYYQNQDNYSVYEHDFELLLKIYCIVQQVGFLKVFRWLLLKRVLANQRQNSHHLFLSTKSKLWHHSLLNLELHPLKKMRISRFVIHFTAQITECRFSKLIENNFEHLSLNIFE